MTMIMIMIMTPDLSDDAVVHPVQLSGAQPDQGGHPGEAVEDGGLI